MQHTPAPWIVAPYQLDEGASECIQDRDGSVVALVPEVAFADRLANAALIVRAPTLLAENDVLRSRIYEMEIMITQAVGAANGSLVQAKEGEPAFMPLLRAALGAKGGE